MQTKGMTGQPYREKIKVAKIITCTKIVKLPEVTHELQFKLSFGTFLVLFTLYIIGSLDYIPTLGFVVLSLVICTNLLASFRLKEHAFRYKKKVVE
jgi:hypothetical protein